MSADTSFTPYQQILEDSGVSRFAAARFSRKPLRMLATVQAHRDTFGYNLSMPRKPSPLAAFVMQLLAALLTLVGFRDRSYRGARRRIRYGPRRVRYHGPREEPEPPPPRDEP